MILAAAQEHSSPSVMLPSWPDLIWGTLCFLVIAGVVLWALPRFNAVLDERSAKIADGLALADRAKGDQKRAETEAAALVEQARREAAQLRETAHADAEAIVAQARAEAQTEAGKALAAARRQLEADKQAAQISLRSDVGLLAANLAEKIVGEQLRDTELSGRVIDRFMDELEAPDAVPASAGRAGATAWEGTR